MVAAADAEEIRRLVVDLAWYIDTGQIDEAVALFTDRARFDASLVGGKLITDHKGLRALMAQTCERAPSRLHLISNHVVDVDGATVSGRLVGLAYSRHSDGSYSLHGIAYEDRYERESDGWKIDQRTVRPMVLPTG
jgi:hypothetical protein